MGRDIGEINLVLLCLEGLAELLDAGFGTTDTIHTLTQGNKVYEADSHCVSV